MYYYICKNSIFFLNNAYFYVVFLACFNCILLQLFCNHFKIHINIYVFSYDVVIDLADATRS